MRNKKDLTIGIVLGLLLILGMSLLMGAGSSNNGALTIQSTVNFCADAGSTDDYACNMAPALLGYITGSCYTFKANTANTGAATIAFNGLASPKTIVKVAGGITTALATNDIRVGQYVNICYDGTNMQMQSTLGNSPAAGVTSVNGQTGAVVGSGSALTLVTQLTASTSNSLDFTGANDCITSTYDDYQIDFISMVLSNNGVSLQLLVSTDGGMTYATTGYISSMLATSLSTGGAVGVTSTSGVLVTNNFGTGVTRAVLSGRMMMYNPANATLNKVFTAHTISPNSTAGDTFSLTGGAYYNSASAVTDFQIIPSAGTITSGTVRCYGVVKT